MQREWQHLVSAPTILVALDLDGTLIPFAPTPHEARVDGDAARLIADLSQLPGVTVGVISGRPRELVDDLPPQFPNVMFAAEHGAWRCANGIWEAALPPIPQLDEIEGSLRALASRHPGAIVERKSCSVCLHWRSVANEAHDVISAAAEVIVDEWLETHSQLERLPVVEALEVRHRGAHKGAAIGWLRARGPQGAPLLAIGDDITDEDMFVSLRDGDVGILVADHPRRTQAALRLPSITSVHKFLRWLIDARRRQPTIPPAEAAATVNLQPARAATLPSEARLVVVSNRLPATAVGRGREVGGLVSALVPALTEQAGIWLGWSGAEREPGLRLRVEDGEAFTRAQFDYPLTWRERFYAGFCNQSLWPLFHCMPGRVRYIDDEWECYVEANRAYAQLVAQAGDASADVWVQDFHLMLVARELRKLGHRGRIGFYLHVPFPPLDVFETMPWAREVMAALLDYDLVGLQSARWADNFFMTARGLLGVDAELRARNRVRVIPVGIDPDRFAEESQGAQTAELGSFEAMLGGRQLLLGVDRLDYSKGIPERLEAFARLLERYSEWRGKVSFVQVSVPTRSEVPEYAELRRKVEALVGRINGAFGEADWTPVRYLYRSYDQGTLARLYRHAAVGVVTPLRDGMNLVAKEYVASQDPDNPGVLVLSQFCGAAEHMTLAQLTNPYHKDGVAADLDAALRMPREERIARHGALKAVVWKDTAGAWARSFLDHLRA